MTLVLPATTRTVLDDIDSAQQPTVEYEIGGKLSGLHNAEGLTDPELKGAWAEAAAFNFTLMAESPWGTDYGPVFSATKTDGTPYYAPDIAQIDEDIINHWEQRADCAQHPVLRARYADVVWDLKKRALNKPADVQYAHRAIDAYLDGITNERYKEPLVHAVEASQRALTLAVRIKDHTRVQRCKQGMLALFDEGMQPGHIGVWTMVFDSLTENKKAGLTTEELDHLIQGLERMLTTCATADKDHLDPWGAEAAARRLASYYERQGRKDEAQRAIRTYGTTFEHLASQATPMLAMSWLQPVHDEYKNRGMKDDAARVQAASAEKGKNIASDLKHVKTSFTIPDEQLDAFIKQLTQGNPTPRSTAKLTSRTSQPGTSTAKPSRAAICDDLRAARTSTMASRTRSKPARRNSGTSTTASLFCARRSARNLLGECARPAASSSAKVPAWSTAHKPSAASAPPPPRPLTNSNTLACLSD
jgi:lysyl-tRNA synthetase class 1